MKPTLIYTYTRRSSFVANDIAILQSEYLVREFRFTTIKALTPFFYIRQLIFLLWNIYASKILMVMFAGHQSFLPSLLGKLLNRPCLIISGGTDCVSFPRIGYGNFKGGILAVVTKWSYRLARHIAPVHGSLVLSDNQYNGGGQKQGIKAYMPGLKTAMTVIHYGFDVSEWFVPGRRTPNSFVTVAARLGDSHIAELKGIDLIYEAARAMPELLFTIVGCREDYRPPVGLTNVSTHAFVSNEKLKEIYNSHEFYIQVSMSEGFPNAICEAMAAGCIPIGSAVGGIPDIIGDAGFLLMNRDAVKFRKILEEAVRCDKPTLSAKARRRIMEKYPKKLREDQLLRLAEKLTGKL